MKLIISVLGYVLYRLDS